MTDPTPPACPICRSSEPAVHGQVTSAADIDAGYPSRICRNAWHDCEPVTGPTDTDPAVAAFEYDEHRAAAILAELMATPMELRLNTATVVFRIITRASDDPFPLLPDDKLTALNSGVIRG